MTPLLMTETTAMRGGAASSANDEAVPSGDGEFADLVDAPATQDSVPSKPAAELQPNSEAVDEDADPVLAMAQSDIPAPPRRAAGETTVEAPKAILPNTPDSTKETGQVVPKTDPRLDEKPREGNSSLQPDKGAVAVRSAGQAIVEGRMPQPQVDQGLKALKQQTAATQQTNAITPEAPPPVSGSQTAGNALQPTGLQAATAEKTIAVPSEPKPVRDAERREAREQPIPQTDDVIRQPNGPSATVAATPVLASAPTIMLDLQKQAANQSLADVDVVSGSGLGERAAASGAQGLTTVPSTIAAQQGQQVAHQIAAAVTQNGGRATEISLNPEELGRVRLSMTAQETTITLTVLAERPETTDLLRRNIDALAQEFRALGYEDINFSFDDGDAAQTDTDDTSDQPVLIGEIDEDDLTLTAMQPTSGLDLRM